MMKLLILATSSANARNHSVDLPVTRQPAVMRCRLVRVSARTALGPPAGGDGLQTGGSQLL